MKLNEAVLERIEELKAKNSMTQYQLSNESTVPQTTLVSLRKGRSKSIKLKTVYRICEGFNISIQEFFSSSIFNRKNLELE